MSPSRQKDPIAEIRKRLAESREEFDAARAELSRACKIVPDIGLTNPGGAALWERAIARYRRAEQAYETVLNEFAAAVRDPQDL